MPEKPATNPLKKKLGPAPVWVWAIVGVVGYYLYRKYASSGTAAALATPTTAASPTSDTTGATGGGVSGGGGASGFSAADVGSIVQPFADALNTTLGYNGQLEQSIIASYLPTGPAADGGPSSNGGGTGPTTVNNYYTTGNKTQTEGKTSGGAVAKAAAKAPTYYTYKAKVPLKAGQTLHFTTGKGYYAA